MKVHIFHNGICHSLSDIAVVKFDKMKPSIKDRVLMCPSDSVSVSVPLPYSDFSLGQCANAREH